MDEKNTTADLGFITNGALRGLVADLITQLQIEGTKSATASADLRKLNLQSSQNRSLLLARIRGIIEAKFPDEKIHSATGGRQQDQYTVTIRLR